MNPDGPTIAALQVGMIGLAITIIGLAVAIIVVIGIVCIVQAVKSRRRHRRRH